MKPMLALLAAAAAAMAAACPPAAATAVTTQDFNGDGYADLAVGVTGEDDEGRGTPDSGGVNVIFGSAAGLTASGNQFFNEAACPGLADGLYEYDWFGYAVAFGDFNGDRYHDLAVGVPGEYHDPVRFAGGVDILYGSATGLTCAGAQSYTPPNPTEGDLSLGNFGSALAVGDFDLDGYEDLAVGNPLEDVNGVDAAGAVHILYGSPAGAGVARRSVWHQASPGVSGTTEARDGFGKALAVGQFGSGPYLDLAIGVPGEAIGSTAGAGAVHVLYGSASGLSSANDDLWTQDATGIEGMVEADDRFGFELVAGNFGNGLEDDLAIGTPYEDTSVPDGGAVNVIYGSSGGLTSARNRIVFQGNRGVLEVDEERDFFGGSLAAADFGYGPYEDLAIGVGGEAAPGSTVASGAVHVIHGSPTGLTTTPSSGSQVWTPASLGLPGSYFARVTAATLGRGSQADLVIGRPFDTVGGVPGAGAATVLYGTLAGLSSSGFETWSQAGSILGTAESQDFFGVEIAAH